MPYNPSLPAHNTALNSAEMRNQLGGLKTLIDAIPPGATVGQLNDAVNVLNEDINAVAANVDLQINGTALNPGGVSVLNISISNPPTQAEVLQVQEKLNELIVALQR